MKNPKSKKKNIGICKLTKKEGVFIKSHLIPQAFTRPDVKGSPFYQYVNKAIPPIKRWSSWYDNQLVIQEGEDILTKLDTWAAQELRNKKLVWSGWGNKKTLGSLHDVYGGGYLGVREVTGTDTKKLRLFILSLLWRAAASEMKEFSEISLSNNDLEQLRIMLTTDNPEPISFFPSSLVQLSTVGIIYNQSPTIRVKHLPSIDGSIEHDLFFYRFYFDGLIIHINIESTNDCKPLSDSNLIIGAEKTFVVITKPYDDSFQKETLEYVTGKPKT